jgi:hypothetical protein
LLWQEDLVIEFALIFFSLAKGHGWAIGAIIIRFAGKKPAGFDERKRTGLKTNQTNF